MENPKFRVGESVRKMAENGGKSGVIKEVVCKNSFGIFEYFVEFPSEEIYCFETELVKVRYVSHKCECGAIAVYGATASKFHHALWCAMRGNV